MGLFEKVTDIVEAPFKIASGVVNGVIDTTHFVGDISRGDYTTAASDLTKVIADGSDIVQGLGSLGASVAPVPAGYQGAQATDPSSKILWGAKMVIEGLEKATGTGTPYDGDEFRESSKRLESVVETLVDAAPHTDRWDGTASQVYTAVNASHRRVASGVQASDLAIAGVLDTEAGQVTRTRKTFDDEKDWLGKFDLMTVHLNATGPGRAIKIALDTAVAAVTVTAAGTAMTILVKNSFENAGRIREHLDAYETALRDTSGKPASNGVFPPIPDDELPRRDTNPNGTTHMPNPEDGTTEPRRTKANEPYTEPSPEEPVPSGPPATPYGMPTLPYAPSAPSTPTTSQPAPPPLATPIPSAAPTTPLAPAAFSPQPQRTAPSAPATTAASAFTAPMPTSASAPVSSPGSAQSAAVSPTQAASVAAPANPGPRAPINVPTEEAQSDATKPEPQGTNPHGK
ncbi:MULTISPECIES: EspA/EspE family type VII secretion system effector [unclassified Mycobacterium]|uniref:EspA/EspE family type VII secretion system effector n=1 Tax=unclassified Mycobacterium TaxID=2642494 RepID=UPI000896DB77|nr:MULTISPECIES: EspA/EspE family type VII secretion system effector [unclassified Mycobacterium]SEA71419.1 hypothetical protein SAMN04488580_10465 [Mycobacterium sp. 283mftsu]